MEEDRIAQCWTCDYYSQSSDCCTKSVTLPDGHTRIGLNHERYEGSDVLNPRFAENCPSFTESEWDALLESAVDLWFAKGQVERAIDRALE
jgi:hypothetical protein